MAKAAVSYTAEAAADDPSQTAGDRVATREAHTAKHHHGHQGRKCTLRSGISQRRYTWGVAEDLPSGSDGSSSTGTQHRPAEGAGGQDSDRTPGGAHTAPGCGAGLADR